MKLNINISRLILYPLILTIPFIFTSYRDVFLAATADDQVLMRWVSALNSSKIFVVDMEAPRIIEFLVMYIFTWIGIADQYVALWLSSITGLFVLFTTISLLMITIIRQSKLSDEAMDRKLSIALSIFILTISITLVFDYKNWGGFIAINDPARHLYSMAMAFISFSLVTNIGNNDKNKRTILALFMVSLIGSINDKIFLVWGGVR